METTKKYIDMVAAEKRLEGADQSYRKGFRDGWTDALLGQSFNTINSNGGNYSAGYRYGYSQQTSANA